VSNVLTVGSKHETDILTYMCC